MSRVAWFLFAGWTLVYAAFILAFGDDTATSADEAHYLAYALDIARHGWTSDLDRLWSGPGYPLLLAPFAWLGCGVHALTLLNAPLLAGSVALLYRSLRTHLTARAALVIASAWACYLPMWDLLRTLMSEPLAACLLAATACYWPSATTSRRDRLVLAVLLAWLVLTKVVWAYALLVSLVVFVGLRTVRRIDGSYATVCAGALLLTLPYLAWTYQQTGRLGYYAAAGGSSLYSMTTPHQGEYGSWIPTSWTLGASRTQPPHVQRAAEAGWRRNHAGTIAATRAAANAVELDSIYRARAWAQLRTHSLAYLHNVAANVTRMLAGWPFSYYELTWVPFFYGGANVLLLAAVVWARRQRIPQAPLRTANASLALLCVAYLCISVGLSAFPRQLFVVYPALIPLAVVGLGVGAVHGAESETCAAR